MITNYVKQLGALLQREKFFVEDKNSMMYRISTLEQEIEALESSRAGYLKEVEALKCSRASYLKEY